MTIDTYQFDDLKLLSPEVQKLLPDQYQLRSLGSNDFARGHLDVLSVLTQTGTHTYHDWLDQFQYMQSHADTYFSIVIEDQALDRVVAVGTLFVERKFVHDNGRVGHIEDIAVANDQQGQRLGLRVIQALQYIGRQQGCYKIILDCATKNIPFYEKCGFQQKESQMVMYTSSK
ncbi:acyl-CoA N-acyltransferase [Hesseltinella vesiculosa]|uniref:Glucosamine 6-phosphate N-acetyltransferase n=1 Tax=Hesseltinella vesiculosa TaxID=101127 RepID=A0A1X2GN39_9FUNG|nr:acyl-CoA N-acyltransferase [Hesseltinella vesiculosa]